MSYRSIHYSSVLHSDSDVRVGPEIVTDPAFLVTRLVPALSYVLTSFKTRI